MTKILVLVSLLLVTGLTACNGQATTEPAVTPTIRPTPTETAIPSPTSSATPTASLTPTATFVPGPASLTGIVSLSDASVDPFATSIEVRQKDTFDLVSRGETDASGTYALANIMSGEYELWVLVTSTARMLPGCDDVLPPDDSWGLGIGFGPDRAMTMENGSLKMGLLLAENLQAADLRPTGFYMVLPDLEIIPGVENKMDVVLLCQ
jgi:hypothetical protein